MVHVRRLRVAARRGVLAVALTALSSVPLGTAIALGAPGVAGAEPIADCTATTGVIVAVDFTSFGGDVERACVLNPPTGEAALQEAGFSPVPVGSLSGFFACQLTDPATGTAEPQTSCVDTPPASAYWTYWHGLPGQSTWTYSQVGAAGYPPPSGSIEFWAFGSTVGGIAGLESCFPSPAAIHDPATSSVSAPLCPTASPPPASAPTPNPPATAAPLATPPATAAFAPAATIPPTPATAPVSQSTGVAQVGSTSETSPGATAHASPTRVPTTPAPSGGRGSTGKTTPAARTATTTASTTSSKPGTATSSSSAAPATSHQSGGRAPPGHGVGGRRVRIADVATSSTHRGHSGSPVGLFAGIGVLALLGGGAGIFAWRRYRRAQL